MKRPILLACLLFGSLVLAQSYEELIAEKACDCFTNLEEITDVQDQLVECIVYSRFEVEKNDPSLKANRKSTVEGIQKQVTDVSAILVKNCPAYKTHDLGSKLDVFYKMSDNPVANKHFDKGNDYMDAKRIDLAIKQYEKSLSVDRGFVYAYDHLAVAYRTKNDLDNAIKTYKKSLEIFPEGPFALQNIAMAYFMQENHAESLKYYQLLHNYYPGNPEGYYGIAKQNWFLENFEVALINAVKAYILYDRQGSKLVADAENLIRWIHNQMKNNDELGKYEQIMAEFGLQ